MKIIGWELKKALTSPIIIGLMIVFMLFNVFLIWDQSEVTDELGIVNKIVADFGHEMDEQMESDVQKYYEQRLAEMTAITEAGVAKSYENAGAFFDDYWQKGYHEVFSEVEQEIFHELLVLEMYVEQMSHIDSQYAAIDLMEVAEAEIAKYGLSGAAAETVREQYVRLEERFEQLVENGEHRHLFFMGEIYQMHSLLFKTLFRAMIFEIMIVVVLMTGYLVIYEFENKTHLLAYATKRGRRLHIDKGIAAIIGSVIVTTVLGVTTLGAYFTIFDYVGLWRVPISSAFNAEFPLPYISWWDMSFGAYLMWAVVLMYVCQLLCSAWTFMIATFVRNSYLVFCIFGVLFGLGVLLPEMMPRDTNLIFLSVFTPVQFMLHPLAWLMESGAFTTFQYYEGITVGSWSLLLLIGCGFCMRTFKRQDIV